MLRMCQINTNKTFSSDFIRWVFHKWMELRAKPNGPKTKDITFGVKIPAGTKRDAPDGGAGGRILSIRKKPAESLQDLAPPSYNLLHPQGKSIENSNIHFHGKLRLHEVYSTRKTHTFSVYLKTQNLNSVAKNS